MTKLIFQIMCVTVVQWSRSFLHVQINRVRLPATLLSFSLYHFFFPVWSIFLNSIFPFGLFFFILTADPAGHALGSIYILSLSPEFYFEKNKKKTVPLYIVLIINIITLKSTLGQLPPKIIKRNLLLVFGI